MIDHFVYRAASDLEHNPHESPAGGPFTHPSRIEKTDNPLIAASSAGTFARIEDKYLVPAEIRKTLLSEIRARMPLSRFSGKKFTEIESIYFDSPALSSFTDHFEIGRERFKLRTRRYGPDGLFGDDDVYHLELKTKAGDGVSRKMRFKIRRSNYVELNEGKSLSLLTGLPDLNPEIEVKVLARRVRQVNTLVRKHLLRSVMRVNYERVAFEDGAVRVTLDENIRYEKIGNAPLERIIGTSFASRMGAKIMRNQFDSGNHSLLEVKHPGKYPDWLAKTIAGLGIAQQSFSKYCYSVATAAAEKKTDSYDLSRDP